MVGLHVVDAHILCESGCAPPTPVGTERWAAVVLALSRRRWSVCCPLGKRPPAGQVLAATPAAAIAGLRRCATLCPHIGGNALPYPALAPVVKPSPVSTTVAADYRLFIDCVKARRGFWSEAGKLARTARLVSSRARGGGPDTAQPRNRLNRAISLIDGPRGRSNKIG